MRYMSKAELLDAAVKIQRHLCAYDVGPNSPVITKGPDICDCKYGATKVGGKSETGCGCPEMREIVALLDEARPSELNKLQSRLKTKEQKALRAMNRKWRETNSGR